MKISPSLKVIVLFAAMVIVMAAQWRIILRLQRENRELEGHGKELEQARAEVEQVTQAAARHELEAESLRAEVLTLRNEVQTTRQELAQTKTSLVQRASGPQIGARSSGATPASSSISSVLPSVNERQVYHMFPAVRTNIAQLPVDWNYVGSHSFYLDDIYLSSEMSRASVLESPDWSPSQPLPLSFTDAETIARDELRKLVHDEPAWAVERISLIQTPTGKWYYAINLRPRQQEFIPRPDSFAALVTLGGKPGVTGLPSARPSPRSLDR